MASPFGITEEQAQALIQRYRSEYPTSPATAPPQPQAVPARTDTGAEGFREHILANPRQPALPIIDLRDGGRVNSANEQEYTQTDPTFWGQVAGGLTAISAAFWDLLGQEEFADRARRDALTVQRETDRLARNATIGVLTIPGSIAGLGGLGAAAFDYGIGRLNGDEEDFGTYLFREGGQAALQQAVEQSADMFVRANPDATPQQLQTFLYEYQNSDAFYKLITDNLRPGLSLSTAMEDWARQVAGMERNPGELTAVDEAQQIIASSLVGLPSSMASAIGRRLGGKLVEELAGNTAARIVGRTAEALTPVTLPLTPTNVAVNAGVGLGINEVIRDTQGMEGLIDQPDFFDATIAQSDNPLATGPEDDGSDTRFTDEAAALSGAGALAIMFSAAFGRYRNVRPFVDAGPTMAQQAADRNAAAVAAGQDPEFLTPGLGVGTAARNVTNSQAPILDAVRASRGQDVADDVEAVLGTTTGTSGTMAYDNLIRHGTWNGLDYRTIPPSQLRAVMDQNPQVAEKFDQWLFAQQALDERTTQVGNLGTQLTDLQVKFTQATTVREQNAILREIADTQTRIAKMNADDPSTRANMMEWDNPTLNKIIQDGNNDADVQKLAQLWKEIVDADIDYRIKAGDITPQEAMEIKSPRRLWAPMREYPYTTVNAKGEVVPATGLRKLKSVWSESMRGPDGKRHSGYTAKATKDISDEAQENSPRVNNPMRPIDALYDHLRSTVRNVETNRVRKLVVDELMNSSWAGKHLRQVKINNQTQFSAKQLGSKKNPGLVAAQERGALTIKRNGMYELYEFADDSLRQALEFAPAMVFRPANWMRKMWQAGTTGKIAPWFAPKAAIWETMSGAFFRREGRSFGLVDTMLRRFTRDNALVSKLLDKTIDPTALFQVMTAIPRQLLWRTYGALGEKIGNDLAKNSGAFAMMAALPGGRTLLKRVGANMVRAYDQSAMGVLMRHNFGHTGFLVDPYTMKTSYDRMQIPTNIAPRTRAAIRGAFSLYSSMLDSIHNSAKYAFFSQNYARMKAAAKGKPIDKKALTRLVNDTRQLSGDMSRLGGSQTYNKITSAIPYSNVTVQATRHILAETARHPFDVGMRVFAGVAIPTALTMYMMSNWDEAAREYYWNQLPTWQRISTIPIPTPETVMAWVQGQSVPFTPEAIQLIPIAPELIPIRQAFIAGMQATGIAEANDLIVGQRVPSSFGDELRAGFGTLANLAMPPAANALFAAAGQTGTVGDLLAGGGLRDVPDPTFAGVNTDKINVNSDIPRVLNDVLGALFGTAAEIGIQMTDAFEQTHEESEEFGLAAQRAMEAGFDEVERRVVDVPLLFNNQNSLYKFTPVSEAVYDFNQIIEPILAQRVVENDSNDRQRMAAEAGLPPYPTIQDPLVAEMTEATHNMFARGRWIDLRDELTQLNALLTNIDGSRTTYSAGQRSRMRDAVIENYQNIQEQQHTMIQSYLTQMEERYGVQFQQQFGVPWTPQNFARAVELVTAPAQ